MEPTFANSARLNQFNDDNANDPLGPMNVRWSQIYLNNKQYGEVRLDLTGTPIYNITKDTNVTELEETKHSRRPDESELLPASEGVAKECGRLIHVQVVGYFALLRVEQRFHMLDPQRRRRVLVSDLAGIQRILGLVRGRRVGNGSTIPGQLYPVRWWDRVVQG